MPVFKLFGFIPLGSFDEPAPGGGAQPVVTDPDKPMPAAEPFWRKVLEQRAATVADRGDMAATRLNIALLEQWILRDLAQAEELERRNAPQSNSGPGNEPRRDRGDVEGSPRERSQPFARHAAEAVGHVIRHERRMADPDLQARLLRDRPGDTDPDERTARAAAHGDRRANRNQDARYSTDPTIQAWYNAEYVGAGGGTAAAGPGAAHPGTDL